MSTTDAEHYIGDLEAVTQVFPPEEAYIMMNLMTFKKTATYPITYKGSKLAATATGQEAYIKYKDMFMERANALGVNVSITFLGKAHTQIVAGPQEGESWDVVLLAKYPSWAAFRRILQDENYKREVQPHRIAALEKLQSFAVTEMADIQLHGRSQGNVLDRGQLPLNREP